jgi:polyisoprenoid-binding protein YceI
MRTLFCLTLLLSLFAAACEDPAANKPRAITSEPAANQAAVPESKGTVLIITPDNSKIEFIGSKVTGKHDGGFTKFTGTIDLVDGKAEESSVSVDIDMASVFTDTAGLTDHLKTGDFFEINKFPRSTFTTTRIEPDPAKGGGNYTIIGDLEMRGVKKSIAFPASIAISDAEVAVKAEFKLNRKDFGIVYAGMADDLIRDDVVIKLDLKTPRNQ